MQFSLRSFAIGKWPPIASHGLFFLLGVVLNNGSSSSLAPEKPSYRPGRVQIALAKSIVGSHPDKLLRAGVSVVLTRLSPAAQTPQCRFLPDFATLKQLEPFPVVDLPAAELFRWSEFFSSKDRKPFRLISLSQGSSLPLCLSGPKVSYGPLY